MNTHIEAIDLKRLRQLEIAADLKIVNLIGKNVYGYIFYAERRGQVRRYTFLRNRLTSW